MSATQVYMYKKQIGKMLKVALHSVYMAMY